MEILKSVVECCTMECCVMEILFSVVECVEECCAMEKLCDGDNVEECCVMEILCCVEQWKYFCSVLYNGVLYDGNTVRWECCAVTALLCNLGECSVVECSVVQWSVVRWK